MTLRPSARPNTMLFWRFTSLSLSLSFPRLEGTPPREQPIWLEVRTVSRAKRSSGTPRAERTSLREPLPYSAQSPQLTPRLQLTLWFFH